MEISVTHNIEHEFPVIDSGIPNLFLTVQGPCVFVHYWKLNKSSWLVEFKPVCRPILA